VEDAQAEYGLLRNELAEYSRELAEKPHCILVSKMDLLPAEEDPPGISASDSFAVYAISGVARTGLEDLAEGLWSVVKRERDADTEAD